MNQPSPERKRAKLLSVSLWNGGSVIAVAGLSVLLCLVFQLWLGVLVGLLFVSSGVMELWGRKLVKSGDRRARFWLPVSQLWLLGVLVVYCFWSMNHSEIKELLPKLLPTMQDLGVDPELFMLMMQQAVVVTYCVLILVSCFYQGGLAWYYTRATRELTAE